MARQSTLVVATLHREPPQPDATPPRHTMTPLEWTIAEDNAAFLSRDAERGLAETKAAARTRLPDVPRPANPHRSRMLEFIPEGRDTRTTAKYKATHPRRGRVLETFETFAQRTHTWDSGQA